MERGKVVLFFRSFDGLMGGGGGGREFWRPSFMSEDIIKMDVKEIVCGNLISYRLA